jgi:hypothetical protein
VVTISKKEEQQQQQQQAKNGYWQNELHSLGIVKPKRKKEPNDKQELENLADNTKQVAMFQNYEVAYSEEGETCHIDAEYNQQGLVNLMSNVEN